MRSKLLLFLLILPMAAMAQQKGSTSYSFKLGAAERYFFRGKQFVGDNTLMGELGVGIGKWAYRVNFNQPFDDGFQQLFGEELVHDFSYTNIVGRRVITYGYRFYDYSNTPDLGQTALFTLPNTQELYTRVAYDRRWNPSYGITYDFDTYKGYYLDFSLTRFWTMSRRSQVVFNLRGGGSFDMDEKSDEERQLLLEPGFFDDDGINHGSVHLKWLWQPTRFLKFEAGGDYHYAFDDALYDEVTVERDNFIWRTTLSFSWP